MTDFEALLDLTGRTAVVTGGGSGIGQASALILARVGADVLALDVNPDGLADTVESAAGFRGNVRGALVDVSVAAQVAAAVNGRRFNVVLNSAGIMIRKPLVETTSSDWERILRVNLTGYFNVLKATVPYLSAGDTIIQIASNTALIGNRYPAYTATKGAILSMTRELAAELGPQGIRVNSISPGVIVTGINRGYYTGDGAGVTAVGLTPLGRLGEAEDVARAVLFLASELASFVHGEDLRVDGGLTTTKVI